MHPSPVVNAYVSALALIERIHRRSQERLRLELERLEVEDLDPGQASLILQLGLEQLTVTELAARSAYHATTMSHHVRRLAAGKYIVYERLPQDRRVRLVRLSEKGRWLLDELIHAYEVGAVELERSSIDEETLQACSNTLQQLEQVTAILAGDSVSPSSHLTGQPWSSSLEPSPEDTVEQDQIDVERLQEALTNLAPEQREALIFVRADGLSLEEAALVCGVPVGTIKSRVHRGRQKLTDLLLNPDENAPSE